LFAFSRIASCFLQYCSIESLIHPPLSHRFELFCRFALLLPDDDAEAETEAEADEELDELAAASPSPPATASVASSAARTRRSSALTAALSSASHRFIVLLYLQEVKS
tara:strand:- start:95 stop:418 length:324 start_codon:yes stop_codon:yes gene_type:complete